MNEILKLLETRDLYVHLLLFKIYLKTDGRTDIHFQGNLLREVSNLFAEEFDKNSYDIAINYLYSQGYLNNIAAFQLSNHGRNYFEDWIQNFESLENMEKEELEKQLPKNITNFFGLGDKAITVMEFSTKLMELIKTLNLN